MQAHIENASPITGKSIDAVLFADISVTCPQYDLRPVMEREPKWDYAIVNGSACQPV